MLPQYSGLACPRSLCLGLRASELTTVYSSSAVCNSSLSNAMHGQNINLPVCVCLCVCLPVCPSVTLFVNSPTGQTPQRIFTVDSLKDADLRKGVLFGGVNDE